MQDKYLSTVIYYREQGKRRVSLLIRSPNAISCVVAKFIAAQIKEDLIERKIFKIMLTMDNPTFLY